MKTVCRFNSIASLTLCLHGGCRAASSTRVVLPPRGRKIAALQPAQSITSARGHLGGLAALDFKAYRAEGDRGPVQALEHLNARPVDDNDQSRCNEARLKACFLAPQSAVSSSTTPEPPSEPGTHMQP